MKQVVNLRLIWMHRNSDIHMIIISSIRINTISRICSTSKCKTQGPEKQAENTSCPTITAAKISSIKLAKSKSPKANTGAAQALQLATWQQAVANIRKCLILHSTSKMIQWIILKLGKVIIKWVSYLIASKDYRTRCQCFRHRWLRIPIWKDNSQQGRVGVMGLHLTMTSLCRGLRLVLRLSSMRLREIAK